MDFIAMRFCVKFKGIIMREGENSFIPDVDIPLCVRTNLSDYLYSQKLGEVLHLLTISVVRNIMT